MADYLKRHRSSFNVQTYTTKRQANTFTTAYRVSLTFVTKEIKLDFFVKKKILEVGGARIVVYMSILRPSQKTCSENQVEIGASLNLRGICMVKKTEDLKMQI